MFWVNSLGNIGFNGAALRRARKGAGIVTRGQDGAVLQWSRAPKSAERYVFQYPPQVDVKSFNGAALRRARESLLPGKFPRPAFALLQWSRAPKSAERSGRAKHELIVIAQLQWRPRSEERGKRTGISFRDNSPAGFNGAALRRARKALLC